MFPVPMGFLWYLVSKIELNFNIKLNLSIAQWKFVNFFVDMCNDVSSTGWSQQKK